MRKIILSGLVVSLMAVFADTKEAGPLFYWSMDVDKNKPQPTLFHSQGTKPAAFKLKNGTKTIYGDVPYLLGNKSSLIFDGIDDCGEVNGLEEEHKNFSIAFWIKQREGGDKTQLYISADNNSFALYGTGKPGKYKLNFDIKSGDRLYSLSAANLLEYGNWTHIAGTWDGSLLKLYINGKLAARKSAEALSVAFTTIRSGKKGALLAGSMDELQIYGRALSKAEVGELANKLNMGAFYYSWYGKKHHQQARSLRGALETPQTPLLGNYESADEKVINTHLNWARDHGIGFFTMSWFGIDDHTDYSIKNYFLQASELKDFKIALFYESVGGRLMRPFYKNGKVFFDKEGKTEKAFISHIDYLAKNYFSHPNYLRINNKPVLFMYITHNFIPIPQVRVAFENLREYILDKYGYELYLVGDEVDPDHFPAPGRIELFDSIMSYTMYLGSHHKLSKATNALLYSDDIWFLENVKMRYDWYSRTAQQKKRSFIPSALAAFNNRGIHPQRDLFVLPHKRNPQSIDEYGLLRDGLKLAANYVDNENRMIMVTSWNEWHEESQIEPVKGPTGSKPFKTTLGNIYKAYGFDLLNVVKDFINGFRGPGHEVKHPELKISEVCFKYKNNAHAQYIEFYNAGREAVDLTGMKLALRTRNRKFDAVPYIDLKGIIPAGSFFLLATSDFRPKANQKLEQKVFPELYSRAGQFALRDRDGTVLDALAWTTREPFAGEYIEGEMVQLRVRPAGDESISRKDLLGDTDNNSRDFKIKKQTPGTR